jgi:CTP-dependent riboflavin kinase
MGTVVLRGRLVSGLGQGSEFTRLDWVRSQFAARLGIDPYPGTLNLQLDEPTELGKWRRLKAHPGIRIEPASAEFCEARGYPARVVKGSPLPFPKDDADTPWADGLRAAIILPDVPGYPPAQIELIAAVNLREALGLEDGDVVSVRVEITEDS